MRYQGNHVNKFESSVWMDGFLEATRLYQNIERPRKYAAQHKFESMVSMDGFLFEAKRSIKLGELRKYAAWLQSNKEIDISVLAHMSEIEKLVNTKLGIKAIEYRVDRRNHYLKLIV